MTKEVNTNMALLDLQTMELSADSAERANSGASKGCGASCLGVTLC
jgi:hypothetical protein